MAEHRSQSRHAGRAAVADRTSRRAEARKKPKAESLSGSGIDAVRLRSWSFVALCAIIALFARYYYWTIWPLSPQPVVQELGAYTMLTDAFVHGQTSLRLPPPPQLLALPDPYDPVQNARYRLHDATLFERKYYFYFGAAPVLLLYLPYLEVFGEFLPERVGTWVFATAAYVVACFLLRLLLTRWWPKSPRWLFYFLCACLGFSNTFPSLLRRPAVYETAIAASQFFVMLALYATAKLVFGCKRPLLMATLAGAAMAAAFGSRPPQLLAAAALGWLLVLGRDLSRRERLRRLGIATAWLIAGATLVLYYNYVRFHSPFEFGNHYMLSGFNVRKAQGLSLARTLPDVWFSVVEPPRIRSRFPFFVLAPNPPFHLPKNFEMEVVAGIIWLAPLIMVLGAVPWLWKRWDGARRLEWLVGTVTLAGLGAVWIFVDSLAGSSMRYQADFATVLFIAASLTIAGLHESAKPEIKKWLIRLVVVLGLFGVLVNAAVGMTGYYDSFRQLAPQQYQSIADWFNPVAKLLAWCGVPPDRVAAPQVRPN